VQKVIEIKVYSDEFLPLLLSANAIKEDINVYDQPSW